MSQFDIISLKYNNSMNYARFIFNVNRKLYIYTIIDLTTLIILLNEQLTQSKSILI